MDISLCNMMKRKLTELLNLKHGGEPQSMNLSLPPAKNTRKVFKQEKNDANSIKLFNCEEETSLSFLLINEWTIILNSNIF